MRSDDRSNDKGLLSPQRTLPRRSVQRSAKDVVSRHHTGKHTLNFLRGHTYHDQTAATRRSSSTLSSNILRTHKRRKRAQLNMCDVTAIFFNFDTTLARSHVALRASWYRIDSYEVRTDLALLFWWSHVATLYLRKLSLQGLDRRFRMLCNLIRYSASLAILLNQGVKGTKLIRLSGLWFVSCT